MFDFSTEKKVQFKLNGKEYSLRYPTLKDVNRFRKELKKDQADEVDASINFLCELGGEKEVIEGLRISHLNVLVEELTQEVSSKKN
jgi:hypothetical protein